MSTPAHFNTRTCAYIKVTGSRCGSPAWQTSEHCWHHHGLYTRFKAKNFTFPALDDANAIQVAVMDVINALLTKTIERADAYALISALWLARNNLKDTSLSPTPVPDSPQDLNALLDRAREEGLAQGLAKGHKQGYRAAYSEMERSAAKKDDADSESLSSYLLRHLRDPKCDEKGNRMYDADGTPMSYTPEETRQRSLSAESLSANSGSK
jgi:hypothetical protein